MNNKETVPETSTEEKNEGCSPDWGPWWKDGEKLAPGTALLKISLNGSLLKVILPNDELIPFFKRPKIREMLNQMDSKEKDQQSEK